jgi:hypothetical protein
MIARKARKLLKELQIETDGVRLFGDLATLNQGLYKEAVEEKAKKLDKKMSELTNAEYLDAYSSPAIQIGQALRHGEKASDDTKASAYQTSILEYWNTWSYDDKMVLAKIIINALALADAITGLDSSEMIDKIDPVLAMDYLDARIEVTEQLEMVFGDLRGGKDSGLLMRFKTPEELEAELERAESRSMKLMDEYEKNERNEKFLNEYQRATNEEIALLYLVKRSQLKPEANHMLYALIGGVVVGAGTAYQQGQLDQNVAMNGTIGAGIGYALSRLFK